MCSRDLLTLIYISTTTAAALQFLTLVLLHQSSRLDGLPFLEIRYTLVLTKQYTYTNMLTRSALPLVDLSISLNSTASSRLQHALLSFGAFRLAVPPGIQYLSENVFKQASIVLRILHPDAGY